MRTEAADGAEVEAEIDGKLLLIVAIFPTILCV